EHGLFRTAGIKPPCRSFRDLNPNRHWDFCRWLGRRRAQTHAAFGSILSFARDSSKTGFFRPAVVEYVTPAMGVDKRAIPSTWRAKSAPNPRPTTPGCRIR